jgi:hypothetical protein
MASLADLSTAIAAAAQKEVVKTLKALLSKVAEDYKLDYSELESKYLTKESLKGKKAPAKGKKAPVKAKVTKVETETETEETSCIAVTKKGERCKCKPRKGETTCGRHKDYDPDAEQPKAEPKKRGRPRKVKDESESEEEKMDPPKRYRQINRKKPAVTRHEHLLEEAKDDCDECNNQGGPFHLKESKEEFEVVDENDLQKRISELNGEESEVEEGEVPVEAEAEVEEGEGEGSEYAPSSKGGESDFDDE